MAYDTTSTSGSRRMITAMFDSRQDASEATERLVQAGIPRSDITTMPGDQGSGATGATGATSGTTGSGGSYGGSSYGRDEGTGFWDSLKDLFLPDEDRYTYAEGLRRGGYLVTVRVSDALYDRAIDILDDEGTIDVEQRAESWRSEGWTGYTASGTSSQGAASSSHLGYGAAGSAGASVGGGSSSIGSTATGHGSTSATSGGTGHGASTATGSTGATSGREESIPIVEEQLRVGKRMESGGRVRVRSYVVETPVQEQVTLRQEHVDVERRSVDRPVTDADRLFQDRTIEVEEKSEQAVVSKEARVKEELVINKEVEQRTQTVSDTVRRTQVEVEDERSRASGTGTTGTTGTTTGLGTDRKDR